MRLAPHVLAIELMHAISGPAVGREPHRQCLAFLRKRVGVKQTRAAEQRPAAALENAVASSATSSERIGSAAQRLGVHDIIFLGMRLYGLYLN